MKSIDFDEIFKELSPERQVKIEQLAKEMQDELKESYEEKTDEND